MDITKARIYNPTPMQQNDISVIVSQVFHQVDNGLLGNDVFCHVQIGIRIKTDNTNMKSVVSETLKREISASKYVSLRERNVNKSAVDASTRTQLAVMTWLTQSASQASKSVQVDNISFHVPMNMILKWDIARPIQNAMRTEVWNDQKYYA